jgi:hypothetical protein
MVGKPSRIGLGKSSPWEPLGTGGETQCSIYAASHQACRAFPQIANVWGAELLMGLRY